MTIESPAEVGSWLSSASRIPMLATAARRAGPSLDKRHVEALIPHRGPALLIDGITRVDKQHELIACRYDLDYAATVLEGHFPGRPVWPGVLQVEAVGQAGLCLSRLLAADGGSYADDGFVLTHILGAQFLAPVTPAGGGVEIVARLFRDGLFRIIVGQCLQRGVVASAAAVRGLVDREGDST